MSSILKALKKLEEERTSAVARPGPAGRSGMNHPQAGRQYKGLFLLCCGVLIGILTVGGWLMVTGLRDGEHTPAEGGAVETSADARGISRTDLQPEAKRPDASGGVLPAESSLTQVQTLPENAGPKAADVPVKEESGGRPAATTAGSAPGAPATGSATASAAGSRAATAGGAAQTIPVPAASPQTIPATTATPARPPVAPVREPVEEVRMPAEDVVTTAAVKPVPSSPPPLFRVSEIYYQAEGGSMAVVDDLPVMEGTVLNGALVEQILADRVRLIVDGLAVEIPLGEAP